MKFRKTAWLVGLLLCAQTCAWAITSADADAARRLQVQKRSSEWMKMQAEAKKLADARKYADAIQKYQTIREQRKELELDLLSENLALAELYEKSGDAKRAEELIKETIQLREAQGGDDDPTVQFPLQTYAEFLKRQHRDAEAKAQLARIAYIEKQRTQPPKELLALTKQAGLTNAQRAARAVEVGDLYLKRDQWSRALMAYQKAVAWDPRNADAYAGRGEAFGFNEQWTKARSDYDRAISLQPNNVRARFQRALLFEHNNQWKLALADFDVAIKAKPDDIDMIGWRAKLYQNTKRPQEAIKDYSRVLQIAPHAKWALEQRALCYKDAKQPEKAAADERAVKELEKI